MALITWPVDRRPDTVGAVEFEDSPLLRVHNDFSHNAAMQKSHMYC